MKRFIFASALAVATVGTLFATPAEEGQFIRTASTPAFETDFTKAAENTVNEVVCIKSFTAPRQQQMMGDPFGMFDFFFGQQQPQQRRQQRNRKGSDDDYVQSGLGSGVIVSED